jgi:hypothetical protein
MNQEAVERPQIGTRGARNGTALSPTDRYAMRRLEKDYVWIRIDQR